MAVLHLTKQNFKKEVLDSEVPVLIDFWAPWCGPCRMVSPIIDNVEMEVKGKAKVCKVNIDEERELAESFNVMSIPTLVVVKDGKITNKSVGAKGKEHVLGMLED